MAESVLSRRLINSVLISGSLRSRLLSVNDLLSVFVFQVQFSDYAVGGVEANTDALSIIDLVFD